MFHIMKWRYGLTLYFLSSPWFIKIWNNNLSRIDFSFVMSHCLATLFWNWELPIFHSYLWHFQLFIFKIFWWTWVFEGNVDPTCKTTLNFSLRYLTKIKAGDELLLVVYQGENERKRRKKKSHEMLEYRIHIWLEKQQFFVCKL